MTTTTAFFESNIQKIIEDEVGSYSEKLTYVKNKNISTHLCRKVLHVTGNVDDYRCDEDGALYFIDNDKIRVMLSFFDNTDYKEIKEIKFVNTIGKTFSAAIKGKYCYFIDYDEDNQKQVYCCLSNSHIYKIDRYIDNGKELDTRSFEEAKVVQINATRVIAEGRGWFPRGYLFCLTENNKKLEFFRITGNKAIRFYTYILKEEEKNIIKEDSIIGVSSIQKEDDMFIYFKIKNEDTNEIENKLLKISNYDVYEDENLFINDRKNKNYEEDKINFYYSKNILIFKTYYEISGGYRSKFFAYNYTTKEITEISNYLTDNLYKINKIEEKKDDIFIVNTTTTQNPNTYSNFIYNGNNKSFVICSNNKYSSSNILYFIDKDKEYFLRTKNNEVKLYEDYRITGSYNFTDVENVDINDIDKDNNNFNNIKIINSISDKTYIVISNISEDKHYLVYVTMFPEIKHIGKYMEETYDYIKEKEESFLTNKNIDVIESGELEKNGLYVNVNNDLNNIGILLELDFHDSYFNNNMITLPEGEILTLKAVPLNCQKFIPSELYKVEIKWYKNNIEATDKKDNYYFYAITDSSDTYKVELIIKDSNNNVLKQCESRTITINSL